MESSWRSSHRPSISSSRNRHMTWIFSADRTSVEWKKLPLYDSQFQTFHKQLNSHWVSDSIDCSLPLQRDTYNHEYTCAELKSSYFRCLDELWQIVEDRFTYLGCFHQHRERHYFQEYGRRSRGRLNEGAHRQCDTDWEGAHDWETVAPNGHHVGEASEWSVADRDKSSENYYEVGELVREEVK